MPPDSRSRQVAAEWMRRARSHLARAKQPKLDEVLWEDLCFDAQQAAEKAIKAVLVYQRVDHPRTHHLSELLGLLASTGTEVPVPIWEADRLTDYAVVTRYPGNRQPVDEEEHRRAVAIAETVVRWAEEVVHAV
jgi:HEPN domain-containing protein